MICGYGTGVKQLRVCNSSSSIATNGVTQYIPPTQGYFVRAATSEILGTSNAVNLLAEQVTG
jgi:hypothetical protein